MENFVITTGVRNDCIIVNEYNGVVSVISGWEGSDGVARFNMVFPRDNKNKQPKPTAVPQQVRLGPPDQAARILQQMVDRLKGVAGAADVSDDDSDIPF